MASLPVAHWFGVVTLGQLFAVALLSGVGQVLSMAAYQSFFVTLVPRDRYVDANSRLVVGRSASFAAGPALGGYLILPPSASARSADCSVRRSRHACPGGSA